MHSKNDPVVDSKSGNIILNNIKSNDKKLVEFDMDRHIIVIGKDSDKVFDSIGLFLERFNN